MDFFLTKSYCEKFNEPKPPLPYFVGQVFKIKPHTPPAPEWTSTSLTHALFQERSSIHPLDRCLLHPPSSGITGHDVLQLKIVELLRAGDRHDSQIVAVQVYQVPPSLANDNFPPANETLVAKFYDTLYFDDSRDDVDAFLLADRSYAVETAIYKKTTNIQGMVIPKFYGSFTLELPVAGKENTTRSVRLILLQKVPGRSMNKLNPSDYSQSERKEILKRIIDAESLLYTNDVWHWDLHPRNIMLVDEEDSASGSRKRKVFIIDFEVAWISRVRPKLARLNPKREQELLPGVPISPLIRWKNTKRSNRTALLQKWIDWEWDPWVEHEYESTRESITQEMAEAYADQ